MQPATGRSVELEDALPLCGTTINSEERSDEAARAIVDAAQALVVETLKRLSQRALPGEGAREDLLALKPHLQEALEALEDITRRRSLTEEELTRQYAFNMLLAYIG